MSTNLNPEFIFPSGTKIVTKLNTENSAAGAVGVVIKPPVDNTHAYRVRFMDGTEVSLKRHEFDIHKAFQRPPMQEPDKGTLYQHVIYRCVIGSRAYGLDGDDSDTDTRGIYLPPADLHWSLYGVPEQLECPDEEIAFWEMQKFIMLALKANPNILECLYTPLVEYITPLAEELREMRSIFLSKLVYQTYNGYVISQFRKLEKDIENHGEIRWKHAMHLIRLLISGVIALREGHIPVDVGAYREQLLTIKRGEMPWQDVDIWRKQLSADFDAAFQSTNLPERPDYEQANAYLIRARRSAI